MATAATDTSAIHGVCASRLQGVRDAFAENFAQGGEVGATVAATVDGKLVVDLWAGQVFEHGTPHVAGAQLADGVAGLVHINA